MPLQNRRQSNPCLCFAHFSNFLTPRSLVVCCKLKAKKIQLLSLQASPYSRLAWLHAPHVSRTQSSLPFECNSAWFVSRRRNDEIFMLALSNLPTRPKHLKVCILRHVDRLSQSHGRSRSTISSRPCEKSTRFC